MMMKAVSMKAFSLLLAMVLAASLAAFAKPRTKIADQGPKVDLEVIVPIRFGE